MSERLFPTDGEVFEEHARKIRLGTAAVYAAEFVLEHTVRDERTRQLALQRPISPVAAMDVIGHFDLLSQSNFDTHAALRVTRGEFEGLHNVLMQVIESAKIE